MARWLDKPSSPHPFAAVPGFYNEGLRCSVSPCLRIFFSLTKAVCLHLWKASLLFSTFAPQCRLTGNALIQPTVVWSLLWHVFTDPARDAVWALCWLVGSRGAAVWDAVRTRPLRGWKWRWPLWVHPQWRGCLCVLAQHRGSEHTQSCKSFQFGVTVSDSTTVNKKPIHDGSSWIQARCC